MKSLYAITILVIVSEHLLICDGRGTKAKKQEECYDQVYFELNGNFELKIHVTSSAFTPSVYLTAYRNGTKKSIEYDIKSQDDETTHIIKYKNDLGKLSLADNGTLFNLEAECDDDLAEKNFTIYVYQNQTDFPAKSPEYIKVDMNDDNECEPIEPSNKSGSQEDENSPEYGSGVPAPTIKTPKTENGTMVKTTTITNNVTVSTENIYSEGHKDALTTTLITFSIVVFVTLSIVILGALTAYYKIIATKKSAYKLSEDIIRHFFDGSNNVGAGLSESTEAIVETGMLSNFAKGSYNHKYEISKRHLKIGKGELGQGYFGSIVKGTLCRNKTSTDVACKRIKLTLAAVTNERERTDLEKKFKLFLREIKIFQNIGQHPNVVQYIGSVTKNIKCFEAYLVMELCLNEDLAEFLAKYKSKFLREPIANYSTLDILEGDDNSGCSISITSTNKGDVLNNVDICTTYTKQDLLRWAIDIAAGMDFLAHKLFVHCDLAARNVLLSKDAEYGRLIGKINDFGLSRHLERNTVGDSEEYYRLNDTTYIPLLWMAPEVPSTRKVSVSTDIWSFGVTMWEIFSLGETPFLDEKKSRDIVRLLQQGVRLCQPDYATQGIFEIMERCWEDAPEDRPRFEDLKDLLLLEYEQQFPS